MNIRNLLMICLAFCLVQINAQSPRKVLVEHFTQASCPPCAYYNPLITPILERNHSKVCWISYQVSWPGYDPMNEHNKGEVQNRVNYYGVTGVPDTYLNAESKGAPTNTISDASIQNAALYPAPYDIKIHNTILEDYNSMEVRVEVTRTGNISGTPILRIAVLEKLIAFANPPGSNGEKEFHHVFKKFLPGSNGINISELDAPGTSKTYTYIYNFENLYDFSKLESAAFIQNDATHEVYQAENEELTLVPNPGHDIAIKESNATGNFSDTIICGTRTNPIVKFINTGNSNVTALSLEYSINGGPVKNYEWTGNLTYLQEKQIILPAIDFTPLKGQNKLLINITKVNGQDDYTPANNLFESTFYPAVSTTLFSTFEFKPAAQPNQVSFKIHDDQNKLIQEGGPWTDNTAKKYFLNLEKDRCYRVTVVNNTPSLNGTYKLFDDQNVQLFQQRVIGQGTSTRDFGTYEVVSSSENPIAVNSMNIQPNPSFGMAVLNLHLKNAATAILEIFNNEGRIQYSEKRNVQSGLNHFELNLEQFPAGLYFVKLNTGKDQFVNKLIIQ